MRIRYLFYILALFVLAQGIVLYMAFSGSHSRGLLCVGEGLTVVLLWFLTYFYGKVIRPLNAIANGMDLLRSQDFNTRLAKVGQFDSDRVVEVFNRMMKQLKEERRRLREAHEFFDLVIAASPMGVIVVGFDDRVQTVNRAACRFLNLAEEDIVGHVLGDLDSRLARELTPLGEGGEETVRMGDAKVYRCSLRAFTDGGRSHPFYLIEPVTAEVVKAEKRAYEKVIRMIAHEVNNTTAGITSTLDTVNEALTEMPDTDDLREVMQVCVERCYRLSRFITSFADVVKIPQPQFVRTSLHDHLRTVVRFMEPACEARHIRLHTDFCAENPMVDIDPTLMEQVWVNILKNAVESIDADGDITIRTKSHPAGILIEDNGKGISEDTEKKLFTPFFSTKPNGQGIGLIFIREVLTMHDLDFSLRTDADGLTRFRIQFKRF
jgi:nitrogen fixation/metabolism regulation signal transduction histidine kinase